MRFLRQLVLIAIALAVPLAAHAAPKPDLWPRWQTSDEASAVHVDHTAWNRFLHRYVRPSANGANRVAYKDVTVEDRAALKSYLDGLGETKVSSLRRGEQLAYWINLYNALTVQVVLEHYPVKSIRDIGISPGLFSSGPWGKKLIVIDGEPVSLDDIEHRILRPIWKDPRIHYAVNCASVGCPNLAPEAFRPEDADARLTAAARAYVNDRRGVSVSDGKLTLSSIYDWFQSDFGGSEKAVLAHLRKFAAPELARAIDKATGIDGYVYDWRLNE